MLVALVTGVLAPAHARASARACDEEAATIVGTSGDDTISGTPDDDVIVALAGNDTVEGLAGDDVVCGGRGSDTMKAGPGKDHFRGGAANDLVTFEDELNAVQVVLPSRGRPGEASMAERPAEIDVLVGVESVRGTSYGDRIQGSDVSNHLFGGDGDDSIDGGPHPDVLEGGSGDDEIAGGGSRQDPFLSTIDVLSGGSGNDLLRGETGRDELAGGPGDDVLDGGGSPPGVLNGDSVSYAMSPAGVTADLAAELGTGEGTDVLIDLEAIEGSVFDDVLTGNAKANQFDAGTGNDELYGGYGADFLFPGEGRNVVDGGEGGETEDDGDFVMYVFSSSGVRISSEPSGDSEQITNVELIFGSHYDDVIVGGPDADRIFSWGGADHISGGAGDDYLDPGGDEDEVDGGEGSDSCADTAERMVACEHVVQSA